MQRNRFFLLLFLLPLLVFGQKNTTQVGYLAYEDDLNDIWGYVDSTGREYALVGVQTGVSIVDLSDPSDPVQLHFLPGVQTVWRDLKTYGHYAYVSNEGGDGVRIIDLSELPNRVSYKDTLLGGAETAHNVWVDEEGFLYVVGTDNFNGGMAIFDLKPNPWRPEFVGSYTQRYVHDVYVRDGLAYAGEINDGRLTVLDVADRSDPVELASTTYANSFTHNTWLNDAGTVCFTTDERTAAYVYSWDVSDSTQLIQLDGIRSSQGQGNTTPHNVHVLDDYVVTSYYKDGLVIFDGSRPHNLVEVAYFDTNELNGGGTDGNWGAYPFLPSGLVLATDIEEGLFIFRPEYIRGAWLEGLVTDSATSLPLANTVVEAENKSELSYVTDFDGQYAVGTVDSGTYRLKFQKFGYTPTYRTVTLNNGQLVRMNVALEPAAIVTFRARVVDAETGEVLPQAQVAAFSTVDGTQLSYRRSQDGLFVDNDFFSGDYQVVGGAWGYVSADTVLRVDAQSDTIVIALERGYYDDFLFDYNWSVAGTATDGFWERGIPIGTDLYGNVANPDRDIPTDFGGVAYVTGNSPGQFFEDDVDNGSTRLISPVMDLSEYPDPTLAFQWWLLNWNLNTARPGNDKLVVSVTDGTSVAEIVTFDNSWRNYWNLYDSVALRDFLPETANWNSIRIVFATADEAPGNVLESGIDGFSVLDAERSVSRLPVLPASNFARVFPNPIQRTYTLRYQTAASAEGLRWEIYDARGRLVDARRVGAGTGELQLALEGAPGLYLGVLRSQNGILARKRLLKQ